MSKRQTKALEYVGAHGAMRRGEYERFYGLSKRQAVRELNEMVESGLIERTGRTSATHYVLSRPRGGG